MISTSNQQRWQLVTSTADAYERYLVPSLFAPRAQRLVDLAAPRAAERVLDVACGTGIVARQVAARVGDRGAVVGVDLNHSMLQVAKVAAADVEPTGRCVRTTSSATWSAQCRERPVDRAAAPGAVSPSTPTGPETTKGTMMITATSRRTPLPRILAASAVLAGVLTLTAPAVGTESPATVPAMQAVTAGTQPSDPRVLSQERHAWAKRMSAARRELLALRAAVRDVPSIRDSVRDRMQLLEWVSTGDVPVEGLGAALD